MTTTPVTPAERGTPIAAAVRQPEVSEVPTTSYGHLENVGNSYFSPVVRIDGETNRAVLQYRDPDTGKVLRQYPPARSAAYKQAERQRGTEKHTVDTKEQEVPRTAKPVAATATAPKEVAAEPQPPVTKVDA